MKATRKEWIGLAVIALPCMLATMDLTVLYLAIPAISADLNPTSTQLLWIVDMYGFLIAGSLMTMGTLGDRIGRRKLLLIGAVAFGLASVLAAFSKSAEMLIFTRGVLGVAGATLAPSTLSLIRNMFLDPNERTLAISIWVTCFSVGAAIGPLMGGVMLEHFRWGSVFLLNVPIMLLLLALGPLLLPEYRDENAGRLDFLSAGLSTMAVLAVIYGLKHIAVDGFHAHPTGIILLGLAIGTLFVHRQKRLADPLIDIHLFRTKAFSASVATNILGCFVAFGLFLFTAQYFQLVLGLSPLEAGLWTAPSSIGFVIGSMVTPRLSQLIQPATIMSFGLMISVCGLLVIAGLESAFGLMAVVSGNVIFSVGLAPIFTLATDLIVGSVPPERAGAAAGISETGTEFGGALGIAILGSIGSAVYRRSMSESMPATLPSEVAESARNTLAGAIEAAQQFPAILAPAQNAFRQALHATAILCAVFAFVTIVLILATLRQPRKPLA